MFGLSYIRLGLTAALLIGLWFAYGWGSQIITNYGAMQAKITKLERDNTLIESRVASYKTLMARRDAAIEASSCKDSIQRMIKNPDTIPTPWDPFNQRNR